MGRGARRVLAIVTAGAAAAGIEVGGLQVVGPGGAPALAATVSHATAGAVPGRHGADGATSAAGTGRHGHGASQGATTGSGTVPESPSTLPVFADSGAVPATTAGPGTTTTTAPVAPAGPTAAAHAPPSAAVAGEVSFIESAQLPDGAIQTYPRSGIVDPYEGSYAAAGLAQAAAMTGDMTAARDAWRWLEWYHAAEGHGGVVTNATVGPSGTTTPTGTVDSTDATAGMFLVALRDAWAATGDGARLAALHGAAVDAVGVIESTQDSDGLTWALPTYHVKYLMDEDEAYAGLQAATAIARALGDDVLAARAAADASRMAAGIASLWDPATGAYDWAKHADGVQQPTDWSHLYPDALEQVWTVAYGLASGPRATTILDEFAAAQPQWAQPQATATFWLDGQVKSQPVTYWPLGVWALLATGQDAPAADALAAIRIGAASVSDAWPYTPAIAGELLIGEAELDGVSTGP